MYQSSLEFIHYWVINDISISGVVRAKNLINLKNKLIFTHDCFPIMPSETDVALKAILWASRDWDLKYLGSFVKKKTMLATKSRPLSCQANFSSKPVFSSSHTLLFSFGSLLFYIQNSFHTLPSSSSPCSSFLFRTTTSIISKSALGLQHKAIL